MGLVIFLLTTQKGVKKALAYLIAQALAFAIWGFVFLNLTINLEGSRAAAEPTRESMAIRTFLGILLLIIAVRVLLMEQDPEALPLKWKSLMERISVLFLFFINLLSSLFQLRFVILLMVGADIINSIQLSPAVAFLGLPILLLVLLWSQILPLAFFLAMKDRRDKVLQTMENWLVNNSRYINGGLLGLIGIVLSWSGLADMASRISP